MVKSYGVVVVACEMKLSSPGTGGTFYFHSHFPIPFPIPIPNPSPSRLTIPPAKQYSGTDLNI